MTVIEETGVLTSLQLTRSEVIADYRLAWESRQASLIGRREVMSGKAKFGIFGDGKELPQLALSRFFQKGDFRSGYYRDQTLIFALGVSSVQEYFAQLYAHADTAADPASGGRQMNAHFATRSLNPDGSWRSLTDQFNTSADISPTGSQMPRLTGLAYASRLYRELEELRNSTLFSNNGSEIAWGMIGNASCAEGMFWETVNAIGVLRSPAIISIWDDGYGISVTNQHQMVKQNIGELLQGFQRAPNTRDGYDVYIVRAWDYPALINTYRRAAQTARRDHVPALIHVTEVTQPQGHSTSGSHERYKPPERLAWEEEYDCLRQFRLWLLNNGIAAEAELDAIESAAYATVEAARAAAWEAYLAPIRAEVQELADILDETAVNGQVRSELARIKDELTKKPAPLRADLLAAAQQALLTLRSGTPPQREVLANWKRRKSAEGDTRYSDHLLSHTARAATRIPEVKPIYSANSPVLQGFQIMNACFDHILAAHPDVVAFGEDLGKIGDVNQGFAGLQEKYGELRVGDTGIRETTIIGQAIGLAMRGIRPIAEIQYLDYLLYALQIMSDDLATVRWRSAGGQCAPVIIRTRGHRLEGVWHSGSLMAGMFNLLHGIHILVPRDMVRAAGFYNTLLKSDDPGLVVEVLNGYRLKEQLPDNLAGFTVPLGVPEVIRPGTDVTLVTYGASCRIVLAAAERLAETGIQAEVVDVQSLLPFDLHGKIAESLRKTSRVVFIDEDVPGGGTAFMLQQVIEKQDGYALLDSAPRTLSAKAHRPAYGSDGNYWSKPNVETVFETVYALMHEVSPARFPFFF
jgi:pyruvate/2-oxoglutarate/acetoin dehydrogenase E1 component/TPP-dependent pyruvate/acetoin dehydrogenase alpha subunit